MAIGLMRLAQFKARLHCLWHRVASSHQAHHVWLDVCPSNDRGVFRVRGVHCTCGKHFWHEHPRRAGPSGEAGRGACDAGVKAAAHARAQDGDAHRRGTLEGAGAIDTLFVTHQADGTADGTSTLTFKSFEMRREKLQGESVDLASSMRGQPRSSIPSCSPASARRTAI